MNEPRRFGVFGGALAALVVMMAVTLSTAASAQPSPADAAAIEHAEALVRAGNALLKDGKQAEACDAYLEAWGIHPTAATAANLGNVEIALGKHRSAAEHLRFALRRFPSDGKPSTRQALEALLSDVMPEVAVVRLDMQTDLQEVTIDGLFFDYWRQGLDAFVDAGPHEIVATRLGYVSERHRVEARKGDIVTVQLKLDTPATMAPASSPAPEPLTREASRREEGKSGAVIGVGAGMAVLGAALGAGFTVAANMRVDEGVTLADQLSAERGDGACATPPPDFVARCEDLKSTLTGADTFTDAAVWSFIGAGAFALGTVTYVLWPNSGGTAARSGSATVRVGIGASGRSVILTGAW